jgi:predicted glycosyl hydrolase (DUF1957 family)
MIDSGAMAEYATRRTKRHLLRFYRLSEQIQNHTIDERLLRGWETQDNIFSSPPASSGHTVGILQSRG